MITEQFVDQVKSLLPKNVNGVEPVEVTGSATEGGAIVAVYFIRSMGVDGKPVQPQPPLTEIDAGDWQQRALHIMATANELRMNAGRIADLAKFKIAQAFDKAKHDEAFFGCAVI